MGWYRQECGYRYSASGTRTGGADRRLSAAPRYPLGRHGHLRSSHRRRLPGGVGADGQSQCPAMGQGRLRCRWAGQVRSARPRHALSFALHDGSGGRTQRHHSRFGATRSVGNSGVRDVAAGRFGGGVPSGITCADGDTAASEASKLLRPGSRGRAHPSGADPRRISASVHSSAQQTRTCVLRPSVAREGTRTHVGGSAVPGTVDADGRRRCGLHAVRGRSIASGNGIETLHREDGTTAREVLSGHARPTRHR